MGDDFEPVAVGQASAGSLSHKRILLIMVFLGVVSAAAGAVFRSTGFAIGILIGFVLAFVNYFWLKRSLKGIFTAAAEGVRPRMLAGKYFLRYLVLGVVIAIIYATGAVPITAVIFGMAGFALAVVVEGIIRIFSGTFRSREI